MFVQFRTAFRHWMFLPAGFLLLVSLPILIYIAFALWAGDLGRLFLGGLVLAGYCLVASVIVRLCIAIDEQILRHERLKPDPQGNYERPLEQQPAPGMQFDLTIVGEADLQGQARPSGLPKSEPLSQERGYVARG